jgi:hypothetical protein
MEAIGFFWAVCSQEWGDPAACVSFVSGMRTGGTENHPEFRSLFVQGVLSMQSFCRAGR